MPAASSRRVGRIRHAVRALLSGSAGFFLGTASRAQETNAPSRLDYAAFRVVAERNIFNANRSGRSSDQTREARRPARVDTFGLVGTMCYEKGRVAFFDGSSSDYRKALRPGTTIAGYTVAEITAHAVKLDADGKSHELRVGEQMRREENGEWKVSAERESFTAGPTTTGDSAKGPEATNSGSGGGEVSDVLKRLMQKREQEMNR